jgi:hypothetical protein
MSRPSTSAAVRAEPWRRSERRLLAYAAPCGNGQHGEGFRMPADPKSRVLAWAGVRKPPMHEPAGPARRGYGDLRSLVPCRRGRGDASALLTTGDAGRGWTARTLVAPFSGGRRTGAGTIRPVMAVVVAPGMQGPDGRSGTAPARGRSWSRRLTTPSSRSRRVVRGVERHHGRSRRRPCGRRSMGMAAVDRAAGRVLAPRSVLGWRAGPGRVRHWPCDRRWRAGRSAGCGGSLWLPSAAWHPRPGIHDLASTTCR